MIKNNAIKRIIISTIALLILIVISIFPNIDNKNNITKEIIYESNDLIPIYVIDQDNLVSRIEINKDNDIEDIPYIIEVLTNKSIYNNILESNFSGILPQNTKLIDYTIDENKLLKLNFSKEFLNLNNDKFEKAIETLVFSLCELENVDKIMIFVENELLKNISDINKQLPDKFDKSFGINKEYNINKIKDVSKTTIYYFKKYNDNLYYVPITKINNDKLEPVEIIVKELKKTPIYENNLISYLTASYELKDYEILEDIIKVSFNNDKLTSLNNDDITEKVKYTLSLSIRDTYNIDNIVININ